MKDLWDSKKFKTALVAAVVAALCTYFGWEEDQVLTVISPLLAFIGMQGLVDFKQGKKPPPLPPASPQP